MYQIRATKGAKKLAKQLARKYGMPVADILLESNSAADHQVQVGDVERWDKHKQRWRDQTAGKRTAPRAPQYGGRISTVDNDDDYPAVRAWCEWCCMSPLKTAMCVAEARRDGAPRLAVYKLNGRWGTLDEVQAQALVHYFRHKHPDLYHQVWEER